MLSRRKRFHLVILLSFLVGCNGNWNSGDRVLVDKFAYDAGLGKPRRFEVVVFKHPPAPVENGIPKNYIKRLLGLPGELLVIFFGQLFHYTPTPEETALWFDDKDPEQLKKLLENFAAGKIDADQLKKEMEQRFGSAGGNFDPTAQLKKQLEQLGGAGKIDPAQLKKQLEQLAGAGKLDPAQLKKQMEQLGAAGKIDADELKKLIDKFGGAVDPTRLWQKPFMHVDSEPGRKLFYTPGKFKIVRKPPEVMLAMRRIVNDNDFLPSDFKEDFTRSDGTSRVISKRWVPKRSSAWVPDDAKGFILQGGKKEGVDWLRYQNIVRPTGKTFDSRTGRIEWSEVDVTKPELITDKLDYNMPINKNDFGDISPGPINRHPGRNWVGDLMLECQLTVVKPEGEFRLEVSRSIYRYQARFDLSNGQCTLFKIHKDDSEEKLGEPAATRVKGPGQYNLRLANFDARLTVWVDDDLPFEHGREYPPPELAGAGEKIDEAGLAERRGPYKQNDIDRPASFGGRAADVKVHHVRLWRDTYYSLVPNSSDFSGGGGESFWRDPDKEKWAPLHDLRPLIMYVQPGHYLCLGDNSPMSSDSRAFDLKPGRPFGEEWGLVPDRLLLGRALMVYYPLGRAGPIR